MHNRVIISRFGGPEVLQVIEEEVPEPESGQVRVKVLAAGVAFADTMMREGVYPGAPQPPFTPGFDIVGSVDKLGEQTSRVKVGQSVVALMPRGLGGYADFVCLPEEDLVLAPSGINSAEAVSLVLNYVTAYQMLHRLARVLHRERILIHGAGGGVGIALLQLGSLMHLEMYGTASVSKHRLITGLDGIPIDYKNVDFEARILELTENGVDVVFDPIGGKHWRQSYDTLRRDGRLVAYGYSSLLSDRERYKRMMVSGAILLLYLKLRPGGKGRLVKWYSVIAMKRHKPQWYRKDLTTLLDLLGKGKITPIIANTRPLREAARAHEDLLTTAHVGGKVVLICS